MKAPKFILDNHIQIIVLPGGTISADTSDSADGDIAFSDRFLVPQHSDKGAYIA